MSTSSSSKSRRTSSRSSRSSKHSGNSDQSVRDTIHRFIRAHVVAIFSKTTCPFCKLTKDLFKRTGTHYGVMELDKFDSCGQFQNELENLTGGRTVPRVFINGECLGGCSDVIALYKSGKLVEILEELETSSDTESDCSSSRSKRETKKPCKQDSDGSVDGCK